MLYCISANYTPKALEAMAKKTKHTRPTVRLVSKSNWSERSRLA